MITVRAGQLADMRTQAQVVFAEEMRAHLQAFSPDLCATLSLAQLRAVIRQGLERAEGYGLSYRGPLRLYLELMFVLGSGFDLDPQYPWAGETLRGEFANQMYRAHRLEHLASAYLRKMQGPDGGHAQQAFYRLETLVTREDVVFRRPNLDRAVLLAIDTIFPSKLEAIGLAAGRKIVERAEQCARQFYDSEEPRPVAILAIMMLMFGAHCPDDPLYPWLGETLRDPRFGDGRTRAARLERRAITWLKAVNERAREERDRR